MKRFLRSLLLLCSSLILVLATVTFAVHLTPKVSISPALQSLGFGVCDGQPCYKGIIPGKTKWADVERMLGQQANSIMVDTGDGGTLWIAQDPNQPLLTNKVTFIHQTSAGVSASAYRLGDLINLYGQPCGGMRYTVYGLLLMLPKGVQITIGYDEDRVHPRLYLTDFEITALDVCQFRSNSAQLLVVKWSGFRNVHYFDNPDVSAN